MQDVKPLSATLISLVVSSFPAVLLALMFARSDIAALPPIAFLCLICLGAVSFLGGRAQNYLAIDRVGASRSSVILGTSALAVGGIIVVVVGSTL